MKRYFTKPLLSTFFIAGITLTGVVSNDLNAEENLKVQTQQVNGPKFIQDSDGALVQIKTDGTKIIKKPDGSLIQLKPDGVKVIQEKDGTLIQIELDGSKNIRKPDGTTIQVHPGE